MRLKYGNLFEPWEIRIAKKVVAEFQREWRCLRRDDAEDLIDDCLIHWLSIKQKINLSGDKNPKAYLSIALKNKLQNEAAAREALRRKPYFRSTSLNELLEENPESPFLSDLNGHNPVLSAEEFELHAKVQSVIKKLTPKQRTICRTIQTGEMTIAELSIKLSVCRKNVYEEIFRIREIFTEEGLREYL